MKNKKIWMGMLAMALVFGMMVVSCDTNGNGDNSALDDLFDDLNRGAPSDAALDAVGLTQAQFNQIRDAGGGGFQGWAIEHGDLFMIWTGRSTANFTSTANTLRALFGEDYRGSIVEGIYFAESSRHLLSFLYEEFSEYDIFFPARSMQAHIRRP